MTEVEVEVFEHCQLLKRSVISNDPRFAVKVMRSLPATSNKMTMENLDNIVTALHVNFSDDQILPEVECYINLLTLLFDMKRGQYDVDFAKILCQKIAEHNRRSLDLVASYFYSYITMFYKGMDQLADIRGFLHARLKNATLHKDFESQGVLINCLLRNYLYYNLYDLANKLVLKETFPEQVSNSQWARYLYYLGRIKAIQLHYSEAQKYLGQSLEKAPSSAIGFEHTVNKLSIIVQLLLGNIPERNLFSQPASKEALASYFELTKAVHSGDVTKFEVVRAKYEDQFKADRTFTLILRLHHNVIKTAIRRISLAYSRISFSDVAAKLNLESPKDAEYIIAKA